MSIEYDNGVALHTLTDEELVRHADQYLDHPITRELASRLNHDELTDLEQEIDDLEDALGALESELDEAKRARDAAESEVESLKEQLAEAYDNDPTD